MRPLLGFFFLMYSGLVLGQTVDNSIYLPIIMETHEKEHKDLVGIEQRQMALTFATTSMSVSSVLMANSEEKLHKGLTQVYDIIDNAGVIAKLVTTSAQIVDIQDRVLEYTQEHPETIVIAAVKEVQIMKKASSVLIKLIMATKESKFNLMDNKQRLDLLYTTVDDLTIIRDDMYKFYGMLKGFSHLDLLQVAEDAYLYNFETEIEDMYNRIDLLIEL